MHARGRLFDHHLAAIGRWRPPGKSLLRSQSGEQRTWPDGAKTSFMSHFVICGQQLLCCTNMPAICYGLIRWGTLSLPDEGAC
jgi:hypothetical protein